MPPSGAQSAWPASPVNQPNQSQPGKSQAEREHRKLHDEFLLSVFKDLPSTYRQELVWGALSAMGTFIPPVLEGECAPMLEKGKPVYDDHREAKLELSVMLKTSDRKVLDDALTRIAEALGMKVITKMPPPDGGRGL